MPPVRAAFCTARNTIEVRETDDPKPGPGEVLVRVRQCGICGTDLHFYQGNLPPSPASLGHEFTGEIAALGEGVEGFAEGDSVAVEPILACQTCSYCRSGQYNLCRARVLLGAYHAGGLAEHVVVPAYGLYRLPDGVDFETGALPPTVSTTTSTLPRFRLPISLSLRTRVAPIASAASPWWSWR